MRPLPASRLGSVVLLLALAACGRTVDPVVVAPPAMVVQSPTFGDADPYDWTGGRPDDYAVHGIDLSRWQPAVDWPTARANGVNFAFIKATEGGDRADPMFDTHWRQAVAAGVLPGAYHFHYFCTPALTQANWFIANVPRQAGTLPPVLDVEWNPVSPTCTRRPDPATVRAEMLVFLDVVGRHFGQRPIIYTTPGFYEDNDLGLLRSEEFWLRSTAGHPDEVYDGARWSFWQYSGTGLVAGIGGPVDLNAYAGSAADWSRWLEARRI